MRLELEEGAHAQTRAVVAHERGMAKEELGMMQALQTSCCSQHSTFVFSRDSSLCF